MRRLAVELTDRRGESRFELLKREAPPGRALLLLSAFLSGFLLGLLFGLLLSLLGRLLLCSLTFLRHGHHLLSEWNRTP